jgi:tetratricopeptide (TPR) repeat protein
MSDDTLKKLYDRGKEAFAKRNYDYAIELFRQILALAPNHVDARKALRICEVKKFEDIGYPSKFTTMALSAKSETSLRMQKTPDKAIETCEAHLARDPRNVRIRIALGQALIEARHIDGAIAELEMARELQPENADLLGLLGRVYTQKQRVAEARACLNKAISLKPEDRLLLKARNDLEAIATMAKGYEKDDYKEAMMNKDQAAKLEQDQHIQIDENQVAASTLDLDQQIAVATTERDKVKLLKKKAEMLEVSGNIDAAQAAYQAALNIDRADSMLRDKVENIQVRKLEAALVAAQEKAAPGNAAATSQLKQLRAEKLKFELVAWERRVKDRPTDIAAHFEFGKRLYASAMVDKAIAEFQMTVKDPKHKIDSYLFLGMSFRYRNLHDVAAAQFQKALESGELTQDKELAIRYEMAKTLEPVSPQKALEEFKRIMEQDINYKDVMPRVSALQAKVGGGPESGAEPPPMPPE